MPGSTPASVEFSLALRDVNESPTGLSLANTVSSLDENSSTSQRIKVADIVISDDELGSNEISLAGADASSFEVEGTELFLRAGTELDFESKAAYAVTVSASDPALPGSTPVSVEFTLSVDDQDELPVVRSIDEIEKQDDISRFKLKKAVKIGGKKLKEIIVGTQRDDDITGTSEGEIIAGLNGQDVLKGKSGSDGFLFNDPGGYGKKMSDIIKDFDSGEGDILLIDKDVFNFGKKITFDVVSGRKKLKKASKKNLDFVYESQSGFLYFNEDAKEKGWGDGGLFAQFQGGVDLLGADFEIV